MIIDDAAYIEHYGVKGMKWGVRKSTQAASKKKFDSFFESASKNPNSVLYVSTGDGRVAASRGEDWVKMHSGDDGKFTKYATDTLVRRAAVAEARVDARLAKRDAKRAKRQEKRASKGAAK